MKRQCAQVLRQPVLRGLHQRAMEGSADGKHDGAFGPAVLCQFGCETFSLNLTTNIWSLGLLERAKASAAAITSSRFGIMLPLLSTTRPTVTGISSRLKNLISCKTPSS